ncbi:MAG: carboxypeptidase regulatory-like domain-containing protein [Candidatus Kerfeldbacteria bacterium]|nr:carboxypeptidase regulatory-like domain-containing protein [Candidatus Kerfeldbacteria bacterium]
MKRILRLRSSYLFGAIFVLTLVALALPALRTEATSYTLSGTVTLPGGGTYTGGGWVNMWASGGSGGGNVESDGSFQITGLTAATYNLNLSVNTSSGYANPPEQHVTVTSNVSGHRIAVANPVLRGTVANPDGTPTTGCVNVHDTTWTINRNACTDSTGAFVIGALDAGTYTMEVSPSGTSSYVTSEQAVTVTNPSTTLDLGLVRLDSPFVVGTVALPDGTLVPWNDDYNQRLHLSVDLWNADRTVNKHSDYDSNSKFKIGRVPAGTYSIHVNVWDTELYTGSAEQTITVAATGLDMTATPIRLSTPQLAGVIYKSDGTTPLQNAWVSVHNQDWTVNQGSSTDQFGKYRLGGINSGTYQFEVNPPSEMTDVVRYGPEDVTITSSLQTKNVTMSAAKKFVTGKVTKDGKAVPCANVNANKRGGNGWAGATTASDGSYTLVLSPGGWNIRVEPQQSFNCASADWIYLDPEAVVEFSDANTEQTETVNFAVKKTTAKIVGKITTKSGSNVTNGNINANSQTRDGQNRWANTQIKGDGTFTLNLIAGTYDVNVWTNDNRLFTKNQKIAVAENETKTVNFVMGEKLAHITGTVTDKAGKGLPNLQINGNLDCGPDGCSAWSNTKTAADGTFDLAATLGRWNLNFDGGQGSAYVYDGPMNDVYVPTETSTVSGVNFALTYADVTIKGKVVDESGQALAQFPGWVYVRKAAVTEGAGWREYGGSVNQGVFNFRVPSSLFSLAEMGIHTPQNSSYSGGEPTTITLVADATIEQNITLKKNDAAIVGRLIDMSGLPLGRCNFRGEVFANTEKGEWHGTQVNPDCTYEISLLAGTYNLGYHLEESAGFLNRWVNEQVTIASGTRAQKDLKVLAGDARVTVRVFNPDGTPARRVWVWANNHREIDDARRSGENKGKDEEFRGPGGTKSPEELFTFCSKKENEKECADFRLPPGSEGPGGCKTALACTQYCQKNKKECDKSINDGAQVKTSSVVKLSRSAIQRKAKISGLKLVRAAAADEEANPYDNMIETGSETNDVGIATLNVVSGHSFAIGVGLPPDNAYMPPREQGIVVTAENKNPEMTLTLRTADGKMTGFVTFNGVAVRNGYVGCWGEDGSNNGGPVINGTYSLNYAFNTIFHCNANAFDGATYYNSGEKIVAIESDKKKRLDFTVGEAKYSIPPAVSESFDATAAHVLTLGDGTTLNIPANAIASSGTVTVNANPTINVQSQKSAQPLGYGYNFEAVDADNKQITTFQSDITMCFKYSDEQLADAGVEEGALLSSYWDASAGVWKPPQNATQDKDNNTICVSSNHFTSYAVVSKNGKGRGQNLTAVSTSRNKQGVTTITIGSGKSKKTIKPFSSYRGTVQVTTFIAGDKAGQVIVAGQTERTPGTTALKVYTVKGKLSQTIKPWGNGYTSGVSLVSDDLTKNGYADLIVAPLFGGDVKVYDLFKKKTYTVALGQRGTVRAETLNLKNQGSSQLAATTGGTVRTWDFRKGKFQAFSYDQRRIRVNGAAIEKVALQPNVKTVSPTSITWKSKGTVNITITGENLGSGSKVLLNQSIAAKKVKATGEKTLVATFELAALKKKKTYQVNVINPDGESVTYKSIKTK